MTVTETAEETAAVAGAGTATDGRGRLWYSSAVAATVLPEHVRHLFWEVSPDDVDLELHQDYVLERVMSRGGWDAMRWLRAAYPRDAIADFLRRRGDRLTPRDRAYWALVAGVADVQSTGGGRPKWAG
jgi:hypothetical protein